MTCETVLLPNGGRAIVCGSSQRAKRCVGCGQRASRECDWKVKSHRSGTCDLPICANCAVAPAPEKDLCPAHAEAFKVWQAERERSR